ncbi:MULTISPECIES: envelope stress response membrane protein PspB [Salinivibrio]|jgi:phage shock protein B|uniref:Phage shock protein B n=1 Tax=Salinivibrio costicola subsp. alcaliphilus TaxID=272773 RepID=A0ABX3KQ45_SALCS|nr:MULTISPECIES: envelope stress response membrane protein PspB [Salinivibrio]NUY55589.1 envelope stress response membrane protein PspB [Salinivibrio sp. EAGSL]OOE93849.1 phage shock protein B [Salinivibrio sp. AR647]OOE95781.1 phage shock protein B [Salinivibrio sp. AR640]OOE98524.1 phage shock protein B [Salinivibrio sp. MA351]OOE99592.1 phage shock protein B [Salinivibrio sp. IB643]
MSSLFLGFPLAIFLLFVAPLWLLLHYRSKRQVEQGLSGQDYETLQQLAQRAEKLQARVDNLERLLDAEAPQWRQRA